MKKTGICLPLILAGFMLTLMNCATTQPLSISKLNVASVYNPASSNIFPEYTAYHQNDSISTIAIRLDTRQLTFINSGKALLKIEYTLYKSLENNIIADSSTYNYEVEKKEDMPYLTLNVNVKTPDSLLYICEVLLTDKVKKRPRQLFIELDRRTKTNCQNYMLISPEYNDTYYRNYFYDDEKIKLTTTTLNAKHLIVGRYNYEFPMPPPPYSTKTYRMSMPKPDTTFLVKNFSSYTFEQTAPMFFFRTDSFHKQGIATFKYHDHFPNVKTAYQLIRPLRYMATAKEYRKLEMAPVKKEALDEFWLRAGGSASKARELIKVYYNRVIFANVYFTSFTEGWRTDRGMIYIIFGPPKQVFKYDNKEKWSYGEVRGMRSLDFTFYHVDNSFATNHYVMERSEKYTSVWIDALGSWRRGKIYFYGR